MSLRERAGLPIAVPDKRRRDTRLQNLGLAELWDAISVQFVACVVAKA